MEFEKEASQNRSWTLQVSGEPGVGKTWLLRLFLLVGCENDKWWRLRCGKSSGLAEELLTSILTRYPRWQTLEGMTDEMISILRYQGTDLTRGYFNRNMPSGGIETLYNDEDFHEIAWQLISNTIDRQDGALRVWVEDLHFSDNHALTFLNYLRTNCQQRDLQLNIVFTITNNGISASVREFTKCLTPDFKLRLMPWDEEEVASLMKHDYGITLNQSNREFAAEFYQRVGGLPFQVTQTLAYLQEKRVLVEKKGYGWGVRDWRQFMWPSSLEQVLESRLERISKHVTAWQVLTAISLSPDPDNMKAVEKALGLSPEVLGKQLSLLYYNGFLDRECRFRQPVIRDVVLQMLSKDEKETITEKLGRALRKSYHPDLEGQPDTNLL